MRMPHPNMQHLVAALPDGSLARALCECFLNAESSDEAGRNVRDVLDKRLAELRKGVQLVGVRVRRHKGLRLMREGSRPILRGTMWKVGDRRAFLWGSGFKPTLRTYDGWEVPRPVQIDVQFGTADIDQVARDIYGLTKLNYNACKLGESEPVTVGFSDMVGEILVSNPTVTDRRPQFRFYI